MTTNFFVVVGIVVDFIVNKVNMKQFINPIRQQDNRILQTCFVRAWLAYRITRTHKEHYMLNYANDALGIKVREKFVVS
jgi:hypothetical protein